MKVLIKLATVICAVGSFSPVPALALNAISSGSVSNNYLFIENAIDSEYFITPSALDPRFSGSNTWIKYGTSQVSLGYLGFVGWTAPGNYYQDMWIDNSPINGESVVIVAPNAHQPGLLPDWALTKTVFIMRRSALSQALLVAPTDSLP